MILYGLLTVKVAYEISHNETRGLLLQRSSFKEIFDSGLGVVAEVISPNTQEADTGTVQG